MKEAYTILLIILIAGTFLPLIPSRHWLPKAFEYLRAQILVLLVAGLIINFLFLYRDHYLLGVIQLFTLAAIAYQIRVLSPYIYFSLTSRKKEPVDHTQTISLLSVNVLQTNDQYELLLHMIEEENPDLILTIESNSDWEKAMEGLDEKYLLSEKIPLENTYGMHLFSKLKAVNIRTHYFVSEEYPSIEAHLEVDHEKPVLVAGDFNTVPWSPISRLFTRLSKLRDGRYGRGFVSTFHAGFRFFRFPIDLVFHSKHISIVELRTLGKIGSDHLPVLCRFNITKSYA